MTLQRTRMALIGSAAALLFLVGVGTSVAQEGDPLKTPRPEDQGQPVEPEAKPTDVTLELVDYHLGTAPMAFLEGSRVEGPERNEDGPRGVGVCSFAVPLDEAQRESLAKSGTAQVTLPAACSHVALIHVEMVKVHERDDRGASTGVLGTEKKELVRYLYHEGDFYRSQSLKPVLGSDDPRALLPSTGQGSAGSQGGYAWGVGALVMVASVVFFQAARRSRP